MTEPVTYPVFIWLMKKCDLIISDSGGIQEEAPYLGKIVVVTREQTERTEALDHEFSFLVGTDKDLIVRTSLKILEQKNKKSGSQIYGDGMAAYADS